MATTPTFYMHQNDTPLLTRTLLDQNGNAVAIHGATVVMHMAPVDDSTATISQTMTVLDTGSANTGQVSYQFVASDTSGLILLGKSQWLNVEYKVTFSGGQVQTFPAPGYDLFQVDAKLA